MPQKPQRLRDVIMAAVRSAGRTPWSFYKVGVKIGYGDILPPLSQIHSHDSTVVFGRRRRPPFVMLFDRRRKSSSLNLFDQTDSAYFASYNSWKCYDLCMAVCGTSAGILCCRRNLFFSTPVPRYPDTHDEDTTGSRPCTCGLARKFGPSQSSQLSRQHI